MPVLKAWLQEKGMTVGGKKADLVEKIEGWFERK